MALSLLDQSRIRRRVNAFCDGLESITSDCLGGVFASLPWEGDTFEAAVALEKPWRSLPPRKVLEYLELYRNAHAVVRSVLRVGYMGSPLVEKARGIENPEAVVLLEYQALMACSALFVVATDEDLRHVTATYGPWEQCIPLDTLG